MFDAGVPAPHRRAARHHRLWQVSGRSLLSTPDMLELDLEYVDRRIDLARHPDPLQDAADGHPRRRSPLMIRTVDPRIDPALARAHAVAARQPLRLTAVALRDLRHLRLRHVGEPHARRERCEPRGGFAFCEVDDFLGPRLLSLPFCDFLDPVVDTDDAVARARRPARSRASSPFQIRVINADAAAPRRPLRAGRRDGVARHRPRASTKTRSSRAWHRRPARTCARRSKQRRHRSASAPTSKTCTRSTSCTGARASTSTGCSRSRCSFFENIWKQFAPDDSIVCGFAEHEGDVIAGVDVPHVGRRLVLQVQRVDLRALVGAAQRAARVGEHVPREVARLPALRLGRQRPRSARPRRVQAQDRHRGAPGLRCCATRPRATRTRSPTKPGRCSASSRSCSPAKTSLTTSRNAAGEILYRYFT